MVERVAGGITAPVGFEAAGVACGIKKSGLDLALLVSTPPARAAAIFTTNLAVAAPLVVTRDHLRASHNTAAAVVVNSGCANACTGADIRTNACTNPSAGCRTRNLNRRRGHRHHISGKSLRTVASYNR